EHTPLGSAGTSPIRRLPPRSSSLRWTRARLSRTRRQRRQPTHRRLSGVNNSITFNEMRESPVGADSSALRQPTISGLIYESSLSARSHKLPGKMETLGQLSRSNSVVNQRPYAHRSIAP